MDSNHRCLVVGQESSPLDHGTVSFCQITSIKLRGLESNQRPPGSEPGVATSSNHPAIFAAPKRKERESNPQGSSLDGFRDRCHRPLACPSVKLPRYELNVHPRLNRPVSYH